MAENKNKPEYITVAQQICQYDKWNIAVKVDVDMSNRTVTQQESFEINEHLTKIRDLLNKNSLINDPEEQEIIVEQRKRLEACFIPFVPKLIQEIPNEYWKDSPRPWYKVMTPIGAIKVGWRKRVIVIDWSESYLLQKAEEIFPERKMTMEGQMIHVSDYDDMRNCLWTLIKDHM